MLEIQTVTVTPIRQNCRILTAAGSDDCVIVDPGGDVEKLIKILTDRALKPSQIWLTHSHFDHCGGVAGLMAEYPKAKLYGHRGGEELRGLVIYARDRFGLSDSPSFKNCPEPDHYIDHGDTLKFGGLEFSVRFVPGHAPDHLVFYQAAEKLLLAGDTVFHESIGRTDLPGGNQQQLVDKIRTQIYTLPEDTKILPGHGDDTTVGHEQQFNPFVSP